MDVDHESTEVDANRVFEPIGVPIEPDEVSEPIGVLIEYCCSDTSILSDEQFELKNGQRIVLVRLTEEHDMSSKEGLDYAMSLIHRYRHLPMFFWSAIPCTGGSTAQRRNKHHPGHDARMAKHNRLFIRLHRNLMILGETVLKDTVNGHFVFEWPYPNDWWQRKNAEDGEAF